MSEKEKPRANGAIPIAVVYHDATESKPSLLSLQASRLTRRCAVTTAMAAILAPLVFGEVLSNPVTITLQGPPQGKGRARAFIRGGRVGHYTPQKTRSYESLIFGAAIDAMGGQAPFEEAVTMTLRAIYPIPASWSERKRQKALTGELKPTKKPDLDNVAKVWNDALNGVVYRDDSQIVLINLEKRYGPQPLVVCTVQVVQ